MEPCKPPKPCGPAVTEAQLQPPRCGSADSQDISACSRPPSAPSRTSMSSRTSTSSGTSTSSRSTTSIKKFTFSRTYKRAGSRCMVLMAETYPPRHVVRRKDMPKADKATQMLRKEWQPRGKKKKKKNKYMSNGQDQPQRCASRAGSAMESCSEVSQHGAPSPPAAAVTPQSRKSMSSLGMTMGDEEGEEQDEAVLELEVKQVDVGEVKSHLPPGEIHFPEENHQEVLEDVAVGGDTVDIQDSDFDVGTMEASLASEELQEALRHAGEDTASADNLGSDLDTVETCLTPEPQEVPSLAVVAGFKSNTQDHDSIQGSVASEVHLTSREKLEAIGDTEEDKVDVSSEGSILATPPIHSNPEELKEPKVNGGNIGGKEPLEASKPASHVEPALASTRSERIAPSPGCASKTSVTAKPLPKKRGIKPLPRYTTRDPSHVLQQGTERKAGKSTTRKQRKAHGKNDLGSFNSVYARGIVFFKAFLNLVELAALPQRTLFQIISCYQQMLSDGTGQEVWMDGDFPKCHKKKPHKTQKETVYSMPSFRSAARISAMNKKEARAHVEHLKGRPYAQVPIFPLVSKQDTTTLAKPKEGSQKVAGQRNKPTTSFRSHTIRERNQVQEAAAVKPPVHHRKQTCSSAVNTECPNTPHALTASDVLPASLAKTQAQKLPAAKPYSHSPALRQRRSLLELWQKISGAQIGLQTGSKCFHQTFCTYSWSWNACRELVTVTDLRRLDRQLCCRRRPVRRRRRRALGRGHT